MEWQDKLTADLNAERVRKQELKESTQRQREKIQSLKRIKIERRKILSMITADITFFMS
jgi:hypothetical protein